MVNTLTRRTHPELFKTILEDFFYWVKEDSEFEHRKGSSHYRKCIVELEEKDQQWFKQIDNFDDYVGFWETNHFMWSDMDWDKNEIIELTRVEKVPVTTYEWKPVEATSEVEIPSV